MRVWGRGRGADRDPHCLGCSWALTGGFTETDAFTLENTFTRLTSVVGEGCAEETLCTKTHRNAAEGGGGGRNSESGWREGPRSCESHVRLGVELEVGHVGSGCLLRNLDFYLIGQGLSTCF